MKPALSMAPRAVPVAAPLAPPRGRWQVGARSETGYVREQNEDRMARARIGARDLYLVIDGMGGEAAGALAAELTMQALSDSMAAQAGARDLEAALRQAFAHANQVVHARSRMPGGARTEGMGATAVALVIDGERALVGHVGDSRAYLWRDGRLKRLTRDHSRVQRMIDAGMITPEQALDHPDASVVERAVGHLDTLEAELAPWLRLRRGDELLLCTDGLCGFATDAEIAAVLALDESPQALVDRLVALSLAKGGQDNVTVQIVRFGSAARPAAAASDGPLARMAGPALVLAACAVAAGGALGYRALQAQQERVAQLEQRIQDLSQDLATLRIALARTPAITPVDPPLEGTPVPPGPAAASAPAPVPSAPAAPAAAAASQAGTSNRAAIPANAPARHAAHDKPAAGHRTTARTSTTASPASSPQPPPDQVPDAVSGPPPGPPSTEADTPPPTPPAQTPPAQTPAAAPPPPPAAAPSGPVPNAQDENVSNPRRDPA